MLSEREKNAVRERVADFAVMIVESDDKAQMFHALETFYQFFCGALEAAKRDARREVLVSNNN